MAYVSIRWGKNAAHHVNYALKDRAPDDATCAHDCSIETATADFEAVHAEHNQEGGNQVLHVMQSFSPNDSRGKSSEEFNALGKSFALENFPGHQFVIKTHTDTEKTHNHIVINTVNSETGKKIENKRALIFRLQDSSDKFCKEYGLSVINREAKERQARLPYKVQQMVRAGKQSYIFDLSQKADVARSIATGFDEYRDILHGFGIRTVIEEKNISYFYPGKERGKRGSKLGRPYGKDGLSEKFQANDKKFTGYPELKERFYSQCAQIQKFGMPQMPQGASNFAKLWSGDYAPWNHPTSYTKISRRGSAEKFQSDAKLKSDFMPAEEIKRARAQSIFEYCKRSNIPLTRTANGETVFMGKEFVTVSEFEFTNTKNGTKGSLIDLVAAHKSISLIQAVAHINNNPRLKLLEQHLGEVPLKYRSFHVPKPEVGTARKVAQSLERSFQANGYSSSLKFKFSELRIAEMGQRGGAWFFVKHHEHEQLQRAENDFISMQHQQAIFVHLHLSGIRLLEQIENKAARSIDRLLIENLSIKKVNFVLFGSPGKEQPNPDILSFLKKRYEPLGISVETHSSERSIQKAIDIDVLGRSPSRGGLDIGF